MLNFIMATAAVLLTLAISLLFYIRGYYDGFDCEKKEIPPLFKRKDRDYSEIIDLEFEEIMKYDGEGKK